MSSHNSCRPNRRNTNPEIQPVANPNGLATPKRRRVSNPQDATDMFLSKLRNLAKGDEDSLFVCYTGLCLKVFATKPNICRHVIDYHGPPTQCKICSKVFLKRQTFREHCQNEHSCPAPKPTKNPPPPLGIITISRFLKHYIDDDLPCLRHLREYLGNLEEFQNLKAPRVRSDHPTIDNAGNDRLDSDSNSDTELPQSGQDEMRASNFSTAHYSKSSASSKETIGHPVNSNLCLPDSVTTCQMGTSFLLDQIDRTTEPTLVLVGNETFMAPTDQPIDEQVTDSFTVDVEFQTINGQVHFDLDHVLGAGVGVESPNFEIHKESNVSGERTEMVIPVSDEHAVDTADDDNSMDLVSRIKELEKQIRDKELQLKSIIHDKDALITETLQNHGRAIKKLQGTIDIMQKEEITYRETVKNDIEKLANDKSAANSKLATVEEQYQESLKSNEQLLKNIAAKESIILQLSEALDVQKKRADRFEQIHNNELR